MGKMLEFVVWATTQCPYTRPRHEELNPYLEYFKVKLAHKGASYDKNVYKATWPSKSSFTRNKRSLPARSETKSNSESCVGIRGAK